MKSLFRQPVLTLGLGLAAWLGLCGTSAAQYTCGSLSSGHCYGVTQWQERPEYFGAYTDIIQSRMICDGCDGFVDNEIWLVDSTSPDCLTTRVRKCWVEAGYMALTGQNGPIFFWADTPPGGQIRVNLLGPVDPVGTADHFMIVKDGRVTPATFLMFIYNDTLSTLYAGRSATLTSVAMRANRINIGQELAGTNGAFAARTHFRRNIWAVRALGPEYVFWYARQTTRGVERSDNPPFARWTISPFLPPPPEGGQFTTNCCR